MHYIAIIKKTKHGSIYCMGDHIESSSKIRIHDQLQQKKTRVRLY